MERFATDYFAACQGPVLEQARDIIRAWTSADERTYALMVEYLERKAKGLRPGLCIAVCRALGGSLEEVLPSAAVVELFHNAFLIHDDIEDGSLERRGGPALHQSHGTSVALNIGDGLLALALRPLLENTARLGLSRTLQILEIVVHMVTESFEGQATELHWIEDKTWQLSDADYEQMVRKKTCCYSFVSPAEVGAVVARAELEVRRQLVKFMYSLGLAFQIQDDLLNLRNDAVQYGKEVDGDLWEGKRSLMLLHSLRSATEDERADALRILARPRPRPRQDATINRFHQLLNKMEDVAVIDHRSRGAIEKFLQNEGELSAEKSPQDISFLKSLIEKYDGVEHGRQVAAGHALSAKREWDTLSRELDNSIHTQFLAGLTDFVVDREY